MRHSWTAADDDAGIDGLGELERLVLSEIDRLGVAEHPRQASSRRHTADAPTGSDQHTPTNTVLDSDPDIALAQIVDWLANQPARDAVVADLLVRLHARATGPDAGEAVTRQTDAGTAPAPTSS